MLRRSALLCRYQGWMNIPRSDRASTIRDFPHYQYTQTGAEERESRESPQKTHPLYDTVPRYEKRVRLDATLLAGARDDVAGSCVSADE